MKLIIFILTVVLSFSAFSSDNYDLILSDFLVESENYDIANSLEEISRISVIIEEKEPETIRFSSKIHETAIKQLVYTLHSKGLTEYSYRYISGDFGVISRVATF